ncbi:MAG: hypothetical protein ABI430_04865 [Candidatus Taylorbacteria bacterium]
MGRGLASAKYLFCIAKANSVEGQNALYADYHLTQRLIIQIPLVVVSLATFISANILSQAAENKVEALIPSQIVLQQEIEMPETILVKRIDPTPNSTVEGEVRSYFKDIPQMVQIAKCESAFRQIDSAGNILRGRVNRQDIGVMQINEAYHAKESKKLGYDIYSLEGNMEYARYLYEKKGSQPWNSSSACWSQIALNSK